MDTNTPKNAVDIITTWKGNATIRQAFGTLAAYEAHLSSPESSPLKIIDDGGKTTVIANNNRQLSPATALEIIETWKTDAAIRSEFKTLNVYQAYCEALTTGKVQIIGKTARAGIN